jgi:glutamate synthase (NADPH/NADH)
MVEVAFANESNNYANDSVVEEQPLSVFPYQDTVENKSWAGTLPLKQGLYDPSLEKDACGVGFAA